MTTDSAALQTAIRAARDRDVAFRRQVRDQVLEQHFDGTWCLPGTQDVLADLNLPPLDRTFTGIAVLHVNITKLVDPGGLSTARARLIRALDITSSDEEIEVNLDEVNTYLDEQYLDDRERSAAPAISESPL
ncbi:hypothetical protein GCM10022222_84830 [Amycolatopsis ultiminotia]|uniref:Uncharacterized protein n=1 Tax=Amycolatopsis ultiminotia TaxID=543629 RepID=A0ABP6YPU0_9PSEU